MSVEEFVRKTRDLLEKEREVEIQETRSLQENVPPKELERQGVCLLQLGIASQHSGMYGRTVLVFQQYNASRPMPSHSFTPGDIAGVTLMQTHNPAEALGSGIVSKVTPGAVHVAFDESVEKLDIQDGEQYKLVKLANDVTYRRLRKCLDDLNSYGSGPTSQLINILFETSPPSDPTNFIQNLPGGDLPFVNDRLDESQKEAVRFALSQRELAVIHGPPGTGKTTTVVEVILQAVRFKQKILVCAPSNIAVDNLVERLAGGGPRIIRLGHPARVLPHIQKYSLDAILSTSDETKLVEDVRKDMDKTLIKMRKVRDKGERQSLREDLKYLRKELRQREENAVSDLLKRADVVLATLTTASPDGPLKHLTEDHFDLVIIDECSQALEAACWLALLHGPRCVLAGDHHQLPPTILSHEAAKEGLEMTLMERVIKMYGDQVVRMLTTQYRMNHLIMQWSSDQLYHGKLQAHSSVAQHLLMDMEGVEETEDTGIPLLLIDTTGCDLHELEVAEEVSKGNEGEADLVCHHVTQLVESGLTPADIAVIAPYNLQVELLRLRLSSKYPQLEVKSVDGFQGREKEAVVMSLVRSNIKGEVGFLAEDRRINVAITRARRHLAVVCDTETVSHHAFLKSLVEYLETNGEVRSAQQYLHAGLEVQNLSGSAKISSGTRPKTKVSVGQKRSEVDSNRRKKQRPGQKKIQENKKTERPPNILPGKDDNQGGLSTGDDMLTRDLVMEELRAFMADSQQKSHPFPTSLTSRERFFVHEVAEQLGLLHISQGEGDERHIVVSKPKKGTTDEQKTVISKSSGAAVNSKTSTDAGNEKVKSGIERVKKTQSERIPSHGERDGFIDLTSEASEDKVGKSEKKGETLIVTEKTHDIRDAGDGEVEMTDRVCPNCKKLIPVSNYSLHKLRCQRVQSLQKISDSAKNEGKKSKNPSKKSKAADKGGATSKGEEDFDALIADAMKMNSTCSIKKCKQNAATLGQNCEFCAKRYCLQHHIPESHGCGDAARDKARQTIVREGVLYRGSGVPDKKPDPNVRAQLQRKLDDKLNKMSQGRQRSSKSNK